MPNTYCPDPASPFIGLERLYYEIKPLLILGFAWYAVQLNATDFGIGRAGVGVLFAAGVYIIILRLHYRGYLR